MNTNLSLTAWDHRVIFYVKQDKHPTIKGVKEIWAERCAVDIELIHAQDIIVEFLPILQHLFIKSGGNMRYDQLEFIKDCAPNNHWKFRSFLDEIAHDRVMFTDTDFYYYSVLAVILSRLRHTETKYLEGFAEYFDKVKK